MTAITCRGSNRLAYHNRVSDPLLPNTAPKTALAVARVPDPCTLVIFGASGDLTKRKLLPAVYALTSEGLLPPSFAVTGFARKEMSDDEFRDAMFEGCKTFGRYRPAGRQEFSEFASRLSYHSGQYDELESYKALKAKLEEQEARLGLPPNRVFYLSTPPGNFAGIIKNLGESGLLPKGQTSPFARVIIEKPFGTDLESARQLNAEVLGIAEEHQVYRIDHYLGKETVQNLLVFRFANGIFEPLWNNRFIDHVQITGAEAIGIEGRGGYFDTAGILRDMVQNHLFQVLCLTAMEPPVAFSADDLRDEKVKVLKALRRSNKDSMEDVVVRGQYTRGANAGKTLIGYREETGVAPGSKTETYVALKLFVDNWRWAGVPFYLRSAKSMPSKVTEVALVFKDAPHRLIRATGSRVHNTQNVLSIRIQPDEGITLNFGSKMPGPSTDAHPVSMDFRYGSFFGKEPPEAYERLLLDCMLGDASLFTRGDEVEASWQFITPIHQAWAEDPRPVSLYEAGTWGPPAAEQMMARDGRKWRQL